MPPRVLILLLLLLAPSLAVAQQGLPAQEEQAIKSAVEKVAPSVVKIETIGIAGQVGDLVTSAPTTGLIVSSDGFIVTSDFSFAEDPESILVTIPGQTRVTAKLIAKDLSRKLVLLKIDSETALPVPEAVPVSQVRVGQSAIAIGRAYDDEFANISIGVVSALGRIWSKAIQTDAKISPNNYGGPLVDIQGRVIGVLTALGPDMMQGGGSQLYDSGIGFAVPLEHILSVLPRWQNGDLHPGILGISLKGGDQFSKPVVIGAARVGSPAFKAGLRTGDTIVEANGRPITRHAEFKHQTGPLYAGDKLTLVALRGENRTRLEAELELVEKLEPYEFPWIGILPQRPFGGDPKHLTVRHVFANSPAADAGLKVGDRIISVNGAETPSAAKCVEKIAEMVPGDKVAVIIERADEKLTLEVSLAKIAGAAPKDLPPASSAKRPEPTEEPKRGVVPIKLSEFPNDAFAYVPDSYRTGIPHGIVIWFSSPASWKQDEIVASWKHLCEKYDLILISPKPVEKSEWSPAEIKFARRVLDEVAKSYDVDPARIVAHGYEGGGTMAYLMAFANSDMVRGAAVVEASLPLTVKPPETNPMERLMLWSASANQGQAMKRIGATVKKLRTLRYPLVEISLSAGPRYLNSTELEELAVWIDSLDRL